MSKMASNSKLSACLLVSLIVSAIILYMDGLFSPFVLDDFRGILWRSTVNSGGLREIFLDIPNRTIPLLMYKALLNIFGPQVLPFHLLALFFHIVNSVLIFFLIRQIFRVLLFSPSTEETAIWSAFGGAMLFAVHPIQSQTVLYSWQAQTAIATCFAVASLLLFTSGLNFKNGCYRVSSWKLIGTFVLFVAAGFSKPNTVTTCIVAAIIVVSGWYVHWKSEGPTKRFFSGFNPLMKILMPWAIGAVLISLPVFFVETQELIDIKGAAASGTLLDSKSYFLTQIYVVKKYLSMAVLLRGFSLDHDIRPVLTSGDFRLWWSLTVHAVIVLSGYVIRKRVPVAFVGILIFYTTHLVESSVFPLEDLMFDHRMYFPFLGICAFIAGLVYFILNHSSSTTVKSAMVLSGLVVFGSCFYVTSGRVQTWTSRESIWADTALKAPEKRRPWTNWGLALIASNNPEKALIVLEKAETLNGKPDSRLYDALALAAAATGQIERAESMYAKGFAINSSDPFLWKSYGVFLANQKKFAAAIDAFDQALQRHPADIHIQMLRAIAMLELEPYNSYKPKLIQFLADHKSDAAFLSAQLLKIIRQNDRAFLLTVFEKLESDGIIESCQIDIECAFIGCLNRYFQPERNFLKSTEQELLNCFPDHGS